jgi:uncharacterized protein (UPF0332 family)
MDKIKWCVNQKNGIELIEPNDNLRDAYIIKAEDSLATLRLIKSKDWELTTAYYTIYHGIYSLLMKIGIKCEIHSCTIEFTKRYLKNHFSKEDFELLNKAFSARNDSQYYVDRKVSDKKYNLIIKKTPLFLVKCKNIILKQKEIENIRSEITKLKNKKKY